MTSGRESGIVMALWDRGTENYVAVVDTANANFDVGCLSHDTL